MRDTGSACPQELPRLFERFHRVEGAGGRSQEGSGIGLALVPELVRMHGGSVAVESQLGRGTTFGVRCRSALQHLPAEHSRDAGRPGRAVRAPPSWVEASRWSAAAEHAPPALPQSMSRGRPGRRSIVLADDNADMREYLARLLATRWDVHAVSDGGRRCRRCADPAPTCS